MHKSFWWFHAALAFGWIASLPFTKFVHILTLPANIFFAKLKPRGELKRVDIETLMTSENFNEEDFHIGIDKATGFTWKQKMDFDACISCGRCEEVCSAYPAKQPFPPKQMIAHFKNAVIKAEEILKRSNPSPAKSLGAAAAEPAEAEKPEIPAIIPNRFRRSMKNHREKSLCCGGGGGHFWMDIKKVERINNLRVTQAKEAWTDTTITSCTFCQQMLDASVKVLNMDKVIRVVDIATLVLRSLGEN